MKKTLVMHIAEAAGGVERYLYMILRNMVDRPNVEHILVCSDAYNRHRFDGLVRKTIVVKHMHNSINVGEDLKSIIAVRKLIRKYRPDVVYCHSSKAGAIGRVADIGLRNKVLYNPHGWSFNMKDLSRKKSFVYKTVERLLALITDRIICISKYEKKSAIEQKICAPQKLVVINNGIDLQEGRRSCAVSRDVLGIPNNAFVVGAICRLSEQKAPDTFVKMAARVKKEVPEAFFVIVGDDIGDGSYRRKVEELIHRNRLTDSFVITGWVDDPLDYASLFDVATLLSRWEGFGLALPEYMMLGKPIVATRADAIPFVVGDAGIIVSIDDDAQAAEAVIRRWAARC